MRLLTLILAASLLFVGTGCGTPSFLITPVHNTQKLREMQVGPGKGRDKIALIEVEGMLINARTGGFLQPTENKVSLFKEQLERAAADENVKAVVLRVNSPGGTVTSSDTMYQLLMRFKERTKKPVIASLQEVCASGGYYVSCASDQIVANPTTVVGSIGVIFNTFDASRGMDKIGLRAEAIKSGPLKDMGSPFRAMAPEERSVMQGMVDEYYARFKSVIAKHRTVPQEEVARATDGRVFSGEHAKAIGLVDRLGLLEDAISVARKMGNAPSARPVMYRRPYGYSGSVYASNEMPQPQAANVTHLQIPGADSILPAGFYYLWQP